MGVEIIINCLHANVLYFGTNKIRFLTFQMVSLRGLILIALQNVLIYRYYGNLQGKSSVKEKKIHPTQKTIILYEWLLQNFAEPGQRILDTHGGSMSHAIAAHKLGFDLTIIEKDPVYYEQAKKRLIEFQRQQVLF